MNKPPYTIGQTILKQLAGISEKIGEIRAVHLQKPPAELRRENRIRTIQSSLEIEGNTLSQEQVTDIFDDKKVLGPPKEILEVKNAIEVYSQLQSWDPFSFQSLLDAHGIMMRGLLESPGKLRAKAAGIARGSEIAHVAPPGEMVYPLLKDLFIYLETDKDILLIRSCVFHYEFEFIHPFPDGNGRMGRLWQTLILMKHSPVFEYLPIEAIIKEKQSEYYRSLGDSDKQGNSGPFIEFMLKVIDESLDALLRTQNFKLSGSERVRVFYDKAGGTWFSRKDYLRNFKNISTATGSRDLAEAVKSGLLEKRGDKSKTQYRYSSRIS